MFVLITGGQRSGKSAFAQNLALKLSDTPVYLATSRIWDEDHRQRILRHQQDRDARWINLEEEKYLYRHDFSQKVVLLDCITLWLTNIFFDLQSDVDQSLVMAKEIIDRLLEQDFTLIAVTNEIGMGGHGANDVQRKFTDLQGWCNQYLASRAGNVLLMVSGLPLEVKGNLLQ